MTDKKKTEDDIVATPESEPETISDQALEDANGGWSWGVTQPTLTSTSTVKLAGTNFETVYGGAGNDDVLDSRQLEGINPKMPDPYGF